MEDMKVPHARSRISLAPSMLKNGRGHTSTHKGMMRKSARKAYEGEGMFDVLKSVGSAVAPIAIDLASKEAKRRVSGNGIFDVVKSVGKAVAPTLIDLASDYAKGKLGGMALPLVMSASQKRTLKKGGAITIKPDMIMADAKEELTLLPASAKKIMSAIVKNKGIRHSLKQGEDLMNRMTGKGLFENFVRAIIPSVKSGLEKVGEPFKAISGVNPATLGYDLGYKFVGPALVGKGAKKRGGNVFTKLFTKTIPSAIMGKAKEYTQKPQDIVADVLDAESPMKIPVINKNPEALLLRGKGGRLVSSRMGCGSPYVSMPYKQALGRKQGGSFLPAGGAGIYPAGKYGMGMVMAGIDVPIQLGNPYLHSSSPAMNPFMPTRGIQSSQSI